MSDYWIVVCNKCKEYVDLEKWNPSSIPFNEYRYLMQHRLRCFNSKHHDCEIKTYCLNDSDFPDVGMLKEVCRLNRIEQGKYARVMKND